MAACFLRGWLVALLNFSALAAPAQSRRLHGLWQQLARHPAPDAARERLLWQLAFEEELPRTRQDSLARLAETLAHRVGDTSGALLRQLVAARRRMQAGEHEAAQAQLQALLPATQRLHDPWLRTQLLFVLGRNQWGTTHHARAEGYWLAAWAVAQRQPDLALRARSTWLLGTFYSDYARAMEWLFRSLHLAEQADDQAAQANAFSSLAYNYAQLGDPMQAQAYYQRALRLNQAIQSPPGVLRVLLNSSEFYLEQGQAERARRGYEQALAYARYPQDQMTVAGGLAQVYTQLGHYALARQHAQRALQLAHQLHDVGAITTLYGTLANLLLHVGQLDSARLYGERAYARRPPGSRQPIMRDVCQILAQTYARQGNFSRAYQFQLRYDTYRDTLTSQQVLTRAKQAAARYQLAQQRARARLRSRDQEVVRLRQQRTLAVGASLLVLLAVGAGLAAVRARQRRLLREAELRTRIAADLHDEVGALLTRVTMRAELLHDSHSGLPDAGTEALLTDSRAALTTMRDVVWSIDAGADTVGALLDRLRDHLDQTTTSTTLRTLLTTDGLLDTEPLAPQMRQHLYLLAKEAITNVVRHAPEATELDVRIGRNRDGLWLQVLDNGPASVRPPGVGGLGLRSMQQRAQALGGQLRVGPRPDGPGWEVRLAVIS
ncbi:tetratricopeptide repeat-containing sensor histidine kinase [Hymenobacter sp. GOD-10R]|uniref:tetratricopeptide repeat-containing sensor histidine kinase n=1 Tax=Hymenobacter sp. GOD-10R TaxID=3093922 RepID=UPI002D77193C|nr:tetratricopeptide repeat protein [Hymenobacter sp. GOD-10R]WRQ26161.1 tetratricopeptide repeat protein [Hymenobacter sp. GOD-10R]